MTAAVKLAPFFAMLTVNGNEFAGVPILSWIGLGGLLVAVAEYATNRERMRQMEKTQERHGKYLLAVMRKLDIYPDDEDSTK